MVKTASTMQPLGTPAPDFTLNDYDGNPVSLATLTEDSKGLLVIFMCNHCPFVKHLADDLAQLARDYQAKGIAVVGIQANDTDNYPDDSPEKMKLEAQQRGYTFPYLFDADQSVAKQYKAACTPDFFVFDQHNKLAYRGQYDDSRPGSGEATGEDVRAALDAVLAGKDAPEEQRPSIGCNIKWKPGNEPEYFNA